MPSPMTRRSFVSHCGATLAATSFVPGFTRHALARNTGTKTAYAYDPRFATYYQNSAETPERVTWINSRIISSGAGADLAAVTPLDDPRTWIQKIHSPAHIAGPRRPSPMARALNP